MQKEKIKNAVTSALQGARDGHRWGNTVASAAKSADQFMTNRNMQGIQARVAGRAAPMGDNVVRGYTGYRAASRVAAHLRANNPPPPGPEDSGSLRSAVQQAKPGASQFGNNRAAPLARRNAKTATICARYEGHRAIR